MHARACIHTSINFVPQSKAYARGKNPLLPQDLTHIMNAIPDSWPTKIEEGSVYTYALGCGARADTAAAVRLKDISLVEFDDVTKLYSVKVSNLTY